MIWSKVVRPIDPTASRQRLTVGPYNNSKCSWSLKLFVKYNSFLSPYNDSVPFLISQWRMIAATIAFDHPHSIWSSLSDCCKTRSVSTLTTTCTCWLQPRNKIRSTTRQLGGMAGEKLPKTVSAKMWHRRRGEKKKCIILKIFSSRSMPMVSRRLFAWCETAFLKGEWSNGTGHLRRHQRGREEEMSKVGGSLQACRMPKACSSMARRVNDGSLRVIVLWPSNPLALLKIPTLTTACRQRCRLSSSRSAGNISLETASRCTKRNRRPWCICRWQVILESLWLWIHGLALQIMVIESMGNGNYVTELLRSKVNIPAWFSNWAAEIMRAVNGFGIFWSNVQHHAR